RDRQGVVHRPGPGRELRRRARGSGQAQARSGQGPVRQEGHRHHDDGARGPGRPEHHPRPDRRPRARRRLRRDRPARAPGGRRRSRAVPSAWPGRLRVAVSLSLPKTVGRCRARARGPKAPRERAGRAGDRATPPDSFLSPDRGRRPGAPAPGAFALPMPFAGAGRNRGPRAAGLTGGEGRPMARAEKEAAVAEITERFQSSSGAVLTEYRGLSVAQLGELRRSLGENATFAVVKNTLTKIAATEAGVAGQLGELLVGPSAIAFVQGDVVEAAKGLRDFSRANPFL